MLATVASGVAEGGYSSLTEAASNMSSASERVYQPIQKNEEIYDALYAEYAGSTTTSVAGITM